MWINLYVIQSDVYMSLDTVAHKLCVDRSNKDRFFCEKVIKIVVRMKYCNSYKLINLTISTKISSSLSPVKVQCFACEFVEHANALA
jgi:hypothetical protein